MSFSRIVSRDLLFAGVIVGAFGDVALQLVNRTPLGNTGLKSYFANQSSLVAVFRAATLTGFWSGLFGLAFPEAGLEEFLLYTAGLDVFYRYYHSSLGFPDLADYYAHSGPAETIAYNMAAGYLVWSAA